MLLLIEWLTSCAFACSDQDEESRKQAEATELKAAQDEERLSRLMQMRAANLQAQAAAKTQFHESVQRFEQWLIDFRTTPPSFNDADACEICRVSVGFGSRHHCRWLMSQAGQPWPWIPLHAARHLRYRPRDIHLVQALNWHGDPDSIVVMDWTSQWLCIFTRKHKAARVRSTTFLSNQSNGS